MAKIVTLKFEEKTLSWETTEGWIPVEAELRPYGTMGWWSWDGETLTRKSATGRPVYRYTIREDGWYKAGPSFAQRVKSPAEEQDPFKRILIELRLSPKILQKVVGDFDLQLGGSQAVGWLTDLLVTDAPIPTSLSGLEERSFHNGVIPAGGNVAVVLRAHYNGSCQYRQIEEVLVWETCTPEKFKAALERALSIPQQETSGNWIDNDLVRLDSRRKVVDAVHEIARAILSRPFKKSAWDKGLQFQVGTERYQLHWDADAGRPIFSCKGMWVSTLEEVLEKDLLAAAASQLSAK